MRRSPFVIGGTVVGLGLVLSFHTKPLHVSSLATTAGGGSSGDTTTTTGSGQSTPTSDASPATTSPSTPASSPTTAVPTNSARSADGQLIQYRYGDIQLRVTEKGSRITAVDILVDDATDPRSQQINSQAVPILQQEVLSAGSANIDGVSGATFTSEAYYQSLQSALDKLSS